MRKRLASLFLAALLLLPMISARAADSYDVHISNMASDTTQNGPTKVGLVTRGEDDVPLLVKHVATYHWNDGLGTEAPGQISIVEYVKVEGKWKEYQVCGTWQATGRNYYGLENVYWDAYPDFVMLPGHTYIVKPSDTSTWSYSEGSKYQGMFELWGNYDEGFNSAITNSFDAGYTCAAWALDEVRQSDYLGIFPESLRHVDLREPITRAEFAAVSVNTYVRLARQAVEPYSPSPFSDTSDRDVLRAYAAQLTDGTGNGEFSPQALLTRQDGATMLSRAYKHALYPSYTLKNDSQFPLGYDRPAFFADDEQIGSWAYESVNFLFNHDVINGVGDNLFAPLRTMTRQEALAISVRMVDNLGS